MDINDLIPQIKSEFEKGSTHEKVMDTFLKKGWTKKDIKQAFSELQNFNIALYKLPDDREFQIEQNKDAIMSAFGYEGWGTPGFWLISKWKLKTKIIVGIITLVLFLVSLYFDKRT